MLPTGEAECAVFFSFFSPLLFSKTCRTPDRYEVISSRFQMWLKWVNGLQTHWGCQETLGRGSSPDIIPRLAHSLSNEHYCWHKMLSWHHLRCILLGRELIVPWHLPDDQLFMSWITVWVFIHISKDDIGWHTCSLRFTFFPLPNTELKLCAVLKLLLRF